MSCASVSARDSAMPHAGHSQTNLTPVAGLPCVPGPAGPDNSQHLADLSDDGALSTVAPPEPHQRYRHDASWQRLCAGPEDAMDHETVVAYLSRAGVTAPAGS
jgi:hypothetical protein